MIAFLHTSPAHVPTFGALAPDARHLVDESLLTDARAGIDVRDRLLARLQALTPADVIVCTCSTLGALAVSLSPSVGVPILRADEPMAAAAVAAGRRIAVVVTMESTVGPTLALLQSYARPETELVVARCLYAWPLFEAGDLEGYARVVADYARTVDADVIVLAQASMAPAADLLADLAKPVLTSPRSAVAWARAVLSDPHYRS
ncbi:aspartate/glutamate racemase family protein [Symbioplanes lichenis]|uniref:aspartate/glutamate racemase family protein n=1 Tax=Symbioplanes lichenis TaxID=1629072 RepID=UPI0027389CAE|nr:aspartate/glutamate racemase family protein [Actinoplanes lichenis]